MRELVTRNNSHDFVTCAGQPVHNSVIARTINSNIFAFIFLLVINLICFLDSLKMFFFAEDVQHVAHAWRAFNGMQHYFWTNFYGIWMNDSSIFKFYRPLPELTFGIDFWLWGTNPVGYHITNLLWHQLATVSLFIFLRKLLLPHGKFEATLVALVSAALFASSPLNPEAIHWLVNRTDLICTVFIMLSLWSYTEALTTAKTNRMMPAALLSMVIALLCKESAIAIPPLTFALFVFLKADHFTLGALKKAARSTLPFWLLLAVYVTFRFIVLDGPGGYTGGAAISFAENLVNRLVSSSSWMLCFYPINNHAESPFRDVLIPMLSVLYAALVAMMFGRLAKKCWTSNSNRVLLFALAATAITLAPTLQCWHLTTSLLSTRFMYIPSAFLGLVFSCLALPIGASRIRTSSTWIAGICWSLLFIAVACSLHIVNNQPWLTTSDSLQKLSSSLRSTIRRMSPKEKVTVLNVPLDERHALTMYSWEHLITHLMPPFSGTREDLSKSFVAAEPYWIGPVRNMSRIEEFMKNPGSHALVWSVSRKALVPCAQGDFPSLGVSLNEARFAVLKNPKSGREPIVVYDLESSKVDPRLAQLVSITLTPRRTTILPPEGKLPSCIINWTSLDCPVILPSNTVFKVADQKEPSTILIPVAENVRWRLSPRKLNRLMVSPSKGYEVSSVELLNDNRVVPKLQATNANMAPNGVFELHNTLDLRFNCSNIPGATSTIVEISEPNVRFHQLSGTYRDTKKSTHASKHITIPAITGCLKLARNSLVPGSYYDVRVFAASGENVVGFSSDPVGVAVK